MASKGMSGGGGSRIAQNAAALITAGAAQIVFTVIQLGVLSRSLGAERFGLFVAQKGFSLLAATLMLAGLPELLVRFLPSFQSRGQRGRSAAWLVAAVAAVTALALALNLTRGRWGGFLPGEVALGAGEEVFRWMILAASAMALKLVMYGGFRGIRDMKKQMYFEMAYQLAFTSWIIAARSGIGIIDLFRMMAFLNLAAFCAGLPVFMYSVSRMKAGPSPSSGGIITPSAGGYWGSALLLSLAGLAFTDVDRFVMSSLLPLAAISLYHVAARMNQLLKRFLGFPTVALQPELTRIYEEGRWSELPGRIALFTKVTMAASLVLTAVAAAVGRDLISLISGEEYSRAYRILVILLVTVPGAAFVAPLTTAMRALHFMGRAVICDFAWMGVYFAGMFLLIPLTGLYGTAASQVAATMVQATLAILMARKLGLYSGAGGARMIKLVAASVLLASAGAAASSQWGIPASAACIVLLPLLFREALRRMNLFDGDEKEALLVMLPAGAVRRAVSWALDGRMT